MSPSLWRAAFAISLVLFSSQLSGDTYFGPERYIDTRGGVPQHAPAIADVGDAYVGSWVESNTIVLVLFSAPFEIPIAKLVVGSGTSGSRPTLLWNGRELLVAWNHASMLFARRFTRTLIAIDAEPIVLATGNVWSHEWASDGANFLAVWTQNLTSDSVHYRNAVFAAVLESSGAVTRSDLGLAFSTTGSRGNAAAYWNGKHYVVVFGEVAGTECAAVLSRPEGASFDTSRQPRQHRTSTGESSGHAWPAVVSTDAERTDHLWKANGRSHQYGQQSCPRHTYRRRRHPRLQSSHAWPVVFVGGRGGR